tara:strand:+ start:532 stop:834 length:303 start_codon:yes stop_codon:yes gene_type:complete
MFQVEMEDGIWEDVANVFWSEDPHMFTVHHWGNVWLVASLTDDVLLFSDDSMLTITMGELRRMWHLKTTALSSGGELRRPRFHVGAVVDKDARPFSVDHK